MQPDLQQHNLLVFSMLLGECHTGLMVQQQHSSSQAAMEARQHQQLS